MAENDKLDVNFKDLARNATQYVFSSTFPSLERMLKTVKDNSDENKSNIEDLNESLDAVSTRIGEVNTNLRKLNDAMAKSLGILGKILKAQGGGSSGGSIIPKNALSNITKTGAAVAGTAGMFSIIEQNNQVPPAPTQQTQSGGTTAAAATPSGQSTSGATAAPTSQATPVNNNQTSGGRSLVIKASTISFEAGQIIFGGSGGSSTGGGGGGGAASGGASGGTGTGGQDNMPKEESQQQTQAGGQAGSFEEAVAGTSGGITTLKTRSGKKYQVATAEAKKFHGFVDELERSGYKINQIGGYRQSAMWHGKGMAIDINPDQNPMLEKKGGSIINRLTGRESSGLRNPRYPFGYGTDNFGSIDVSSMAKKHGLGWGGNWKSSVDTMHFSAGPNEMTEPTREAVAARGGSGGGSDKGEGETKTASAGGQATPVSKPAATSMQPQGPDESGSAPGTETKENKKPAPTPPAPSATAVASAVTKGSQLNKESTSSEMASVTPPSRASMDQINNVGGGSAGGQSGGSLENPKLSNSNRAGNVEPEDAAQRYKALFGIDPRVPTGQSARVA